MVNVEWGGDKTDIIPVLLCSPFLILTNGNAIYIIAQAKIL